MIRYVYVEMTVSAPDRRRALDYPVQQRTLLGGGQGGSSSVLLKSAWTKTQGRCFAELRIFILVFDCRLGDSETGGNSGFGKQPHLGEPP